MTRLRYRLPSRHVIFYGLMSVSFVILLLPVDMLSPLRSVTQILALPQMGLRESGLLLSEFSESTATEVQEQQRIIDKLTNALAASNMRNRQLMETRETLTGLREAGLGKNIRLIPARIAAGDLSPGRASLLLAAGSHHGVAAGDWVASRVTADPSEPENNVDAALPRECIIGWIDETQHVTSRVILLNDTVANKAMPVLVAGKDGSTIRLVLQGRGSDGMKIPDIPATLVEDGQIELGELVTTTGEDHRLPVPLVVGQIIKLDRHRDRRLYFDAIVQPRFQPDALREVYVIHHDAPDAGS